MQNTIKLQNSVWTFDDDNRIGDPGGFGEVFSGESELGDPVAIKRLKVSTQEAGFRELEMAEFLRNKEFDHILPVEDYGIDPGTQRYYVVMPIADHSLEAKLRGGDPISDVEALEIVEAIALGLQEIPDITHRDLKPANILFHESKWKIADFGIARFVVESTASNTLRAALSPQYAAPEQWNHDRPSQSTDVYSMGCIAYQLFSGQIPFTDQKIEELKQAHIGRTPPKIDSVHPSISSLVIQMLRKKPQRRPDIDRILAAIEKCRGQSAEITISNGMLASVNAEIAQERSEEESEDLRQQTLMNERKELHQESLSIFDEIKSRLESEILGTASEAILRQNTIELGNAHITIVANRTDAISFETMKVVNWDTVTCADIAVKQISPKYTWSASLFFAKQNGQQSFRWYEISFMDGFAGRVQSRNEPFSLAPGKAIRAMNMATDIYQVASRPVPIDDEDTDAFVERWLERFALAARGALQRPSSLPLK